MDDIFKGLTMTADGYFSYVGLNGEEFKRACKLNDMIRDIKIKQAVESEYRQARNFAVACLVSIGVSLAVIGCMFCFMLF